MLSVILILFIGGGVVCVAITAGFTRRGTPPWKRILAPLASALLILGALGFFGAGLSATGGLNWLPPTFEWPVGRASGIISLSDGTHVVPHTPSGRIQIYEPTWRFVRGWHVDAGGGKFKLSRSAGDQIEVITARGHKRYVFDVNGRLISSGTYAPAGYGSFPESHESHVVPTKPWLWTFTIPGFSWLTVMIGMVGLIVFGWGSARKVSP